MNRHKCRLPFQSRDGQAGLTLLEVLIALVVLSIGMVGLGALLVTALSNVHSSSQYSLASALALDFEERLWFELATRSADDPDSLANGCLTVGQIGNVAAAMEAQWNLQLASWNWTATGARRYRVPGLTVTVDQTDVTTSQVTNVDGDDTGLSFQKIESVQISWDEGRFDLAGEEESVEIAIGLVCRPVFI